MILGSQGGPLERPWEGFWEEILVAEKKSKNDGEGASLGGTRDGW